MASVGGDLRPLDGDVQLPQSMPPPQLTAAAKVATATVVTACLPTVAASTPPLYPPTTASSPCRRDLPDLPLPPRAADASSSADVTLAASIAAPRCPQEPR